MTAVCPVTGYRADVRGTGDALVVNCAAFGGPYEITGTAYEAIGKLPPVDRIRIATFILDERRLGSQLPRVTGGLLERAAQLRPLSVMERVHRLYRFIAGQSPVLGSRVPFFGVVTDATTRGVEAACVWTESATSNELKPLLDFGITSGHLTERNGLFALSVPGWAYVEELDRADRSSDQAFVAMWFNEDVAKAYVEGIVPAIRETGYTPMRIDQKEHANRIDDEIVAEIRRSRFLVADFTCGTVMDRGEEVAIPRGGVYYEAGLAQGLGIPVIWMCREDHINHVHFDTRQFNHITWKDPADLRVKLRNRIGAVLGDGPHAKS